MSNKLEQLRKVITRNTIQGWLVSVRNYQELMLQPGDYGLRFYGSLILKKGDKEAYLPDPSYEAYADFSELNDKKCTSLTETQDDYIFSFSNGASLYVPKNKETGLTFEVLDYSETHPFGIPEEVRSKYGTNDDTDLEGLEITEILLMSQCTWSFLNVKSASKVGWLVHYDEPDIRINGKKASYGERDYFPMMASLVGHKIAENAGDAYKPQEYAEVEEYDALIMDNGAIIEIVDACDYYHYSLYDAKAFKPNGPHSLLQPKLIGF